MRFLRSLLGCLPSGEVPVEPPAAPVGRYYMDAETRASLIAEVAKRRGQQLEVVDRRIGAPDRRTGENRGGRRQADYVSREAWLAAMADKHDAAGSTRWTGSPSAWMDSLKP